ncbi:hypothetical protein ROZALSC1DRAFT_28664 [Rozella allomycis CSF55]|uniref:AP-2 complex subunit sigma n=1 Tax=Rozella allomycis (strain CSF55) TaxID=988480 RepID=A0A4V1IZZ5_ROZAC|nr:hypothetical protein ROZALSC1DRAFT_28664 [Rozella allomycis CSF55]
MTGESRIELLNWINSLLQLNYTKIEQLGTGAAYCQILDSIYGDVQMSKVKFDTNQVYEYVNNFKVLQNAFAAHGIEKVVPVEGLMKLKFQDNIEFTQWLKKFWDQNYGGNDYDPISRRKSKVATTKPARNNSNANASLSFTRSSTSSINKVATGSPAPLRKLPSRTLPVSTSNVFSNNNSSRIEDMEQEIAELRSSVGHLKMNLEKAQTDRTFYYSKLISVETYLQANEHDDNPHLAAIRSILYRSNEDNIELIRFILVQNRQGKTRLSKWYIPLDDEEKNKLKAEVHRIVASRDQKHQSNFTEFRNYKIVYRRYAGLFFCFCVDANDNELGYLEAIHFFVEILDSYFGNVCELDLVFNFYKVYAILDEIFIAGEMEEVSKPKIMERLQFIEKLE